jgi:hypothetical protein
LADILGVEIFQLFLPAIDKEETDEAYSLAHLVVNLRDGLKTDICKYIDKRFSKFLNIGQVNQT